MCELLDTSIPENGILQSSYRINSFIYTQIQKIRDAGIEPKELLNSPDFVDFTYTFVNVYIPGLSAWQVLMEDALVKNANLVQDQASTYITYSLIFNLLVMFLLIYLLEKNIRYQITTICYCYKVLSVEIVADNPIVKMVFLRLMRLSIKYF